MYSVLMQRCWLTFHQRSNTVHCSLAILFAAHAQNGPDCENNRCTARASCRGARRFKSDVNNTIVQRLFAEQFYSQKGSTSKDTGHCQTRFHVALYCLLHQILPHFMDAVSAQWFQQTRSSESGGGAASQVGVTHCWF